MVCPFCQAEETSVVDSRKNSEGTSIRRRRSCISCKTRFTTYEKASIGLIVVKRNGNREEFNIDKLYSGVKNAFALRAKPPSLGPLTGWVLGFGRGPGDPSEGTPSS